MLAFEKLRQLRRVNARNRNMRANTVDHQREQQKDQAPTKVAEFAGFCQLSCVSCHVWSLSDADLSDASASRFDSDLGSSRSTNASELHGFGDDASFNDFDDLGEFTHQAGLLESDQIDFSSTE